MMSDTQIIDALRAQGCDTAGALSRMSQDAAFYTRCLSIFYADDGFALLGEQLKSGDAAAAFDTAHALKGVSGNLGLTPLYEDVSRLVTLLRAGTLSGTDTLYARIMEQHALLGALL